MQELQSFIIKESFNNQEFEFEVKEKDADDSVMYEIFFMGKYCLSFSKEGDILFVSKMNKLPGAVSISKLVDRITNMI